MNIDPIIIGIAGGTGSGKSTLADNIKKEFAHNITMISHDCYYKAHPELPFEERAKLNYDHPDSIETSLLIEHLKELKNCNFETKSTSLHINILKDSSFLQVLPNGILHIKTEKKTTFLKSSSLINCANSTNTQLIIGLENKELLYFEFDTALNKPEIKVIGEKISFIEFCPVNENNLMSKYVAICINENNINLLSLEKDKLFFLASSIKIPDDVSSIKILQINKNYIDNFLAFVGLKNGVLVIINFSKH